jgi:hypothetical protein
MAITTTIATAYDVDDAGRDDNDVDDNHDAGDKASSTTSYKGGNRNRDNCEDTCASTTVMIAMDDNVDVNVDVNDDDCDGQRR